MLASSSRSHFFKHLSCTFCLPFLGLPLGLVPLPPPLSPFTHFSASSRISSKARQPWNLSSIVAGISTSSSSTFSPETSNTDISNSSYLSVLILCRKDVADMLSDALLCFGASSASMDEQDCYEGSDEICISSIFTEHEDVGICISHAVDSIGLKEMPSYEVIMGEQCDWIKKTQESFLPVEVAEGLWIVPEWRTPPDVQATNIILNPGLAFGTGEHPSTKLCLLLLHGLIKGGELFLDYGTGSGILGIAALKFGAALSVGVDVDPKAITSARQNAGLNNIGPEKMRLCLVQDKASPPTRDGRTSVDAEEQSSHGMKVIAETDKYDIVIANILLNPLIELADHIAAYAKPGAVVGVSGILSEQLPKIIERYSQFLEGISVSEMDGWACVSGTKKEIY